MILKGSQRSGATQMGLHLLKTEENEHVEVHEVRGFVADDVMGAMKEAQAIAQGTRCKQHLFSLSLSPPEGEPVPVAAFEEALDKVEQRLGLAGQPRVVVFHEKEGRRHAHAVWSRIDADVMKAVHLPFFKTKLREVSKELYLGHDWRMPAGLVDSKARDPKNFDLSEWQQAKRIGRDSKQLKSIVQECWAASDSGASFAKALEERGLYLACGDRRGHVALTLEGEALSVARYVGKPAKEIAKRLGSPVALRSVNETRAEIARTILPKLKELIGKADEIRARDMAALNKERLGLRDRHRRERDLLDAGQKRRALEEARARSERLRKGLYGLFDRLTGKHAETQRLNDTEALAGLHRDRAQRDSLVAAQLKDRQTVQIQIRAVRQRHAARLLELHRDLSRQSAEQSPPAMRGEFTRSRSRGHPFVGTA